MYNITIIPGDGIGHEVMEGGKLILDKLNINFRLKEADAGFECFQKTGETISDETIKIAKSSDAVLYGATTSTPNEKSPIITLRKELDTYGNLRPVKSFKGVKSLYNDLDFLIVRENTEGLYSQIEELNKDKATALRVITKKASERISNLAFKECIYRDYSKVTCVHKSNVLKKTDGVFKESFYKIAKNYPKIHVNDYYVDATAMYLLTKPQEFDVIVTSNLYGDILSDEAAGLVGGLGFAPSGNIGEKYGLFEPVHGSAPDIAGKYISNPCAMILSIAMMLDYLGEIELRKDVVNAVEEVLKDRKTLTPDLGGVNTTIEMSKAIGQKLNGSD
ncbi:isocitrate/isopropylmalate dehydrogenase family protein [Methanobrevibacter sp. OttesenSCG-928-K11]|nr:isocitrate/isopropylmalate dehydrogenase family protein [Methanobrevibacter sp. OttesenSCG-928-K11]MDL2270348.1 isocitrate/isopropylmalate dehydrogenase family protein [Methanobrevibacter sp. OttesenSCG-928-I08]